MTDPVIVETGLGNFYREDDIGEECQDRKAPRLSVTLNEMAILADLFRGKTALEFGTGIGVSTRAIAQTAVAVYTFDPDQWVAENVVGGLPENVTFAKAHTTETADGAFIDGDHTYEAAKKDIETAFRFTKCDPLVIHDAFLPEVRAAIDDSGLKILRHSGAPCYMVECERLEGQVKP